MTTLVAEVIAVACLVAVLAFAVVRPRGLPEGVGAVPAALLRCSPTCVAKRKGLSPFVR